MENSQAWLMGIILDVFALHKLGNNTHKPSLTPLLKTH